MKTSIQKQTINHFLISFDTIHIHFCVYWNLYFVSLVNISYLNQTSKMQYYFKITSKWIWTQNQQNDEAWWMIYFFFNTITKRKYILKHDWAIYIDISFREIATLLKCTKYHPRDIYLTFKWIFACIMVSNLQPTSHKVFSSMWLNLLQMMLLNVKKEDITISIFFQAS